MKTTAKKKLLLKKKEICLIKTYLKQILFKSFNNLKK